MDQWNMGFVPCKPEKQKPALAESGGANENQKGFNYGGGNGSTKIAAADAG
jgi:hypothetical protein